MHESQLYSSLHYLINNVEILSFFYLKKVFNSYNFLHCFKAEIQVIKLDGYLINSGSEKAFKDTVKNRTCHSRNKKVA